MGFYENSHSLRDGAILVYTRPGQKKVAWHARLKVPGVLGYIIKSLKTGDLNAAITEAEDLFYSFKAEQKLGLDVKQAGNLKFRELWKRFYAAHELGLSIHRRKLHKLMSEKYFIPYFGETRVADMPDAFVEKYWDWRINFHKEAAQEKEEAAKATAEANETGKPKKKVKRKFKPNVVVVPAQKTLDMEAGLLRQLFRWGKRIGAVKREPWIKPTKVKFTKGTDRRPSFTEAEWKSVYEYLRAWVKEPMQASAGKRGGTLHRKGPHALHRYQRELLRNYLLFMANSGLRPNEARQLQWRDVRVEKEGKKATLIVEIAETTKTGARTVVCRDGAHVYLDRLKAISKHASDDDLIFCGWDGEPIDNFNKTFHAVLRKLGLLNDRWGKRRTVYSLRHFYCTEALLSGVPIHTLARNMGTSIAHIEHHYSHVLTLMQAKELSTKKFRRATA
ncbi:MAG TPA: tyrosine-type recombinase/integrase [Rhizomicrobium sp.]